MSFERKLEEAEKASQYIEILNKMPAVIYLAIENIKKCFGETDVEVLSKDMYRTPASEFYKYGQLGIDIKINGIKTFLSYEHAENIISPFGNHIAEEIVYSVMKAAFPEKFK